MAKPNIIYEDQDVLVVDKPAGISVYPGLEKHPVDTVASLLAEKLSPQLLTQDRERAGIVHRLDKNTSGVMIVAKTLAAKNYLQAQFKSREVEKIYLALVEGVPKHPQAKIELPIGRHPKNPLKRSVRPGGKPASSNYKIIGIYTSKNTGNRLSLLEVKPQTGRTHQIRVHLAHLDCPLVGDTRYGHKEPSLDRHWLHANSLTLRLPNGHTRTFKSPLPPELTDLLKSYNRL